MNKETREKISKSLKLAYKNKVRIPFGGNNPNPVLPLPPKEDLERYYLVEKKSTREIAIIYGVTQHPIRKWLKYYGIKARTYKENIMPVKKGSHLSKEHSLAISLASIGKPATRKGKDHWHWKGGITPLNLIIRNSKPYKRWRESVFKRDNWTCQNCGIRGGKLRADHIKPFCLFPELRFDINNGRTLCLSCDLKIGWQLFKDANPKKKLTNIPK
jgi:hypothetical protein